MRRAGSFEIARDPSFLAAALTAFPIPDEALARDLSREARDAYAEMAEAVQPCLLVDRDEGRATVRLRGRFGDTTREMVLAWPDASIVVWRLRRGVAR